MTNQISPPDSATKMVVMFRHGKQLKRPPSEFGIWDPNVGLDPNYFADITKMSKLVIEPLKAYIQIATHSPLPRADQTAKMLDETLPWTVQSLLAPSDTETVDSAVKAGTKIENLKDIDAAGGVGYLANQLDRYDTVLSDVLAELEPGKVGAIVGHMPMIGMLAFQVQGNDPYDQASQDIGTADAVVYTFDLEGSLKSVEHIRVPR